MLEHFTPGWEQPENWRKVITREDLVGLDFETYCDLDLFEVGLDRYFSHPSFRVTLAAIVEYEPTSGWSWSHYQMLESARQDSFKLDLGRTIRGPKKLLVAHNAQFERKCLEWLGFDMSNILLVDSAVISRMFGGSSKLEYAARQFTSVQKLESGKALIKKFACPHPDFNNECPDITDIYANPVNLNDWQEYERYCRDDAIAGCEIVAETLIPEGISMADLYRDNDLERQNEHITAKMNEQGWTVDLEIVDEMQRQYLQNIEELMIHFQDTYDVTHELNVNSPMQLTKWCEERGVKMKSFNKEAVDAALPKVEKQLGGMPITHPKFDGYHDVYQLLKLKQELGGTALKKLQVIKDTTGNDGRLRYQYMHVGAGQTFRTTGKGVQMQNLKRLGKLKLQDMRAILEDEFDNATLGENLRQVFTSRHPDGQLIVGDFSSVESRGAAWLAGADWKLDEFRAGKDMYKVAAEGIFGVPYDEVTKDQRQVGKVAELSCGYGGAERAVDVFAKVYGLGMEEDARIKLTADWRQSNPEIVDFWAVLDEGLKHCVATGELFTHKTQRFTLFFRAIKTPDSLKAIHAGARSVAMELHVRGKRILSRVFHGCYTRGRNVGFYKPGETQNGPAWSASFVDRKTNRRREYDVYGGKLMGILTQSMCRELFFYSLRTLEMQHSAGHKNWEVIGQFHDEIVIDWWPEGGGDTLEAVLNSLKFSMEDKPYGFSLFPLEADINHDYRYIK